MSRAGQVLHPGSRKIPEVGATPRPTVSGEPRRSPASAPGTGRLAPPGRAGGSTRWRRSANRRLEELARVGQPPDGGDVAVAVGTRRRTWTPRPHQHRGERGLSNIDLAGTGIAQAPGVHETRPAARSDARNSASSHRRSTSPPDPGATADRNHPARRRRSPGRRRSWPAVGAPSPMAWFADTASPLAARPEIRRARSRRRPRPSGQGRAWRHVRLSRPRFPGRAPGAARTVIHRPGASGAAGRAGWRAPRCG